MNHINLRVTHRYLYQNMLFIMLFSLYVGAGMLLVPDLFFNSKNYHAVIGEVASAKFWGTAFLFVGVLISMGLFKFSYRFTLVGMVLFSSICAAWSIGLLLLPLAGLPASLTGAGIYGLASMLAISTILESTINPTTAIKRDSKGDDEK